MVCQITGNRTFGSTACLGQQQMEGTCHDVIMKLCARAFGTSRGTSWQNHGGTTEEDNCSYLLPLSHRDDMDRATENPCWQLWQRVINNFIALKRNAIRDIDEFIMFRHTGSCQQNTIQCNQRRLIDQRDTLCVTGFITTLVELFHLSISIIVPS